MAETRVQCFACGEAIEPDDWVIPLQTYAAHYRGDELTLNADKTVETVIHAACLERPSVNSEVNPPPWATATSATLTATPRITPGRPTALDSEVTDAIDPEVPAHENPALLQRLYDYHDGRIAALHREYPFTVSKTTVKNRLAEFEIYPPPEESDVLPGVDEESFTSAVELATNLDGVANILGCSERRDALETAVYEYGLEDELDMSDETDAESE